MYIAKIIRRLANIGVGRYTLPNALNWLALRLVRAIVAVAGLMISCAVFLDPKKSAYKKNLINLGYPSLDRSKNKAFSFFTVVKGCMLLSEKTEFFDVNKTVKLTLPKVINKDIKLSEKYICEAKLPDTYLAELNGTIIFGGTDLIIAKDLALYDEIDRNKFGFYANKSLSIEKILKEKIIIKMPKVLSDTIDCGIHFTKDHSRNYYHWLIECIPRLSLIRELDKNIPLLIDDELPSQSLEVLRIMNSDNRPLIKIRPQKTYLVKKLYYPSKLSIMYDNYNIPDYGNDIIYSPKAINFVRSSILNWFNVSRREKSKKIYISRNKVSYRNMINSDEIENLLISKGFEIICPERMTFFSQLYLFSQAQIIIGQAGAGMTNLIFAPKDCKVLIITSNIPQINLHCFSSLAHTVGINVEFLIGICKNKSTLAVHSDFYADTKLLLNYLNNVDQLS